MKNANGDEVERINPNKRVPLDPSYKKNAIFDLIHKMKFK